MTREEMQERIKAALARYEAKQQRPKRWKAWRKKGKRIASRTGAERA